ncbi:hypothetical protein [Novosphingobium sp. ES2-1]|uniref:hypothetical protein n=1 Tax=Novosphingobium sp. ES2-1 TaxID=2780074 RepID=UPI001882CFAE|nr:hypothetical protein [Novosphingobium sp. ES2-1]QOV92586.1 hypothetical protein IM701_07680 [Novosphingobium sp. ES2-1]
MLSEAMKAEGWLPWNGEGPCPVPLDSRPDVMFRDSEIERAMKASFWAQPGPDWWKHQSDIRSEDIIAYKPEARHD